MKPVIREQGKPALEVIEESVSLLRRAPAGLWAAYCVGTLPFVSGLLFFWGDMSRSAFARGRLAEASLGVALLYCWMKVWHAVFARGLFGCISGRPPESLTRPAVAQMVVAQAGLQPVALLAMPVALLITIPFGWVYAFFQNLTALSGVGASGLRPLIRRAVQLAALWPRQNHILILLLTLFSAFVLLNWGVVCVVLPYLAKSMFGIETVFSRGGTSVLNSTFLAVNVALTYVCVSPLSTAVYALRCFYGMALESGADLKAELQRVAGGSAVTLLCIGCFLSAFGASAQEPADTGGAGLQASATHLDPEALDSAVEEVLSARKYAWRLPREQSEEPGPRKGVLGRFLESIRDWWVGIADWLQELIRKLFERERQWDTRPGSGWTAPLALLLYGLAAVLLLALGLLLFRAWQGRRERPVVASQPVAQAPDIADENVGAEQLPEDGWIAMAGELLEQGEFRLALRAFFLAGLAHLAARRWLSLARYKSNRDYEQELRRRGHVPSDLLQAFAANRAVFEEVWYGARGVNLELLAWFRVNLDTITSETGGDA